MFRWLVVLVILSSVARWGETKKKKRSNGGIYSYQGVNHNGNVHLVDVIGNGGNFQTMDSNGNVQTSYYGGPRVSSTQFTIPRNFDITRTATFSQNVPFRGTRIISVNGNTMIHHFKDANDDDYYDSDDPSVPISHFAKLMNNFVDMVSREYNSDINVVTGNMNIPEYIFIHYYSGGVVSPSVLKFSGAELSTCPKVTYCLNQTRPLCIGKTTYCVAPLRKTATCSPRFRNGKLPCLTTTISSENVVEEPIIVPCVTTLEQTDMEKKYCVTMIAHSTDIRETMQKVQRTVQNQLSRAQVMMQDGLNAGRIKFVQGMDTLKRALSGLG